MDNLIRIIARKPEEYSDLERAEFRTLVEEGEEVKNPAALKTNIESACILVSLLEGNAMVGVAALKHPQRSYRARISKSSGFELPETEFPYELGYIYIRPHLRRTGLSHRLVDEALKHRDGCWVFATVRRDNDAMRAALMKAGFEEAGHDYKGDKHQIGLLVRKA